MRSPITSLRLLPQPTATDELITDFKKTADGEYQLAFDSLTTPGATSAVVYRQASAACWEFEYQLVAGETGQTIEACRH
ncbi:MAG: hypothetical protein AAF827_23340 [Cyanobacteria bacterium P01_D01_bin.6]